MRHVGNSGDVGLFLGLATLDLEYLVSESLGVNQKVRAEKCLTFAGGPATNAAIAFAALGGSATLVTAIGKSALGQVAASDIQSQGVRLIDGTSKSDPLPVSSVIVQKVDGQRSVVSMNDQLLQLRVNLDELDPLLARANVMLVDGHYMSAALEMSERAKTHGVTVIMDGGSWKPRTDELLPFVDFVICSKDFAFPGAQRGNVLDDLLAAGVRFAAVSRGDQSLLWASGDASGSIPVAKVDTVDTSGSGDILHGAFASAISRKISAKERLNTENFVAALEYSVQVASESCRYFGTRGWIEALQS